MEKRNAGTSEVPTNSKINELDPEKKALVLEYAKERNFSLGCELLEYMVTTLQELCATRKKPKLIRYVVGLAGLRAELHFSGNEVKEATIKMVAEWMIKKRKGKIPDTEKLLREFYEKYFPEKKGETQTAE